MTGLVARDIASHFVQVITYFCFYFMVVYALIKENYHVEVNVAAAELLVLLYMQRIIYKLQ